MHLDTIFSMALFFAILLLWLAAGRLSRYLDRLLEQVDTRQANRLISGLLVAPIQVTLLAGVLVLIWFPEEAVLRLSHLVFVLGALFSGLLGALMFWLPLVNRLDRSAPALLTVLICLPMSLYFLPLGNFTGIFGTERALLAGAAGALALVVYCLVLFSLRRSVLQRPLPAA